MIRMIEEMRKLKNMRLKPSKRGIRDNDFKEMQVRGGDASRRIETGVLRSDSVDSKLLQDNGNRAQTSRRCILPWSLSTTP